MTLKEHIDDIQKRLERNEFESEAAVRQGIIERLLGVLAWPTFDTKVVFPEYGVEGRKVDYALCNNASTPCVFIEVKRVGNIDEGIKQLFEYAFHTGVPIVVLTDGQKWRFYHPAGEGSYEDRKVVELDLIVEDSEECAKSLNRYLNYELVQIGEAAEVIAEDYKSIVNQRKIEERLPEVWSELVQEQNEYLLLAVMEKAKEKFGYEPTEKQVLTFLKSLQRKTESKPVDPPPKKRLVLPNDPRVSPQLSKSQFPLRVTMPDGEVIDHRNASDTFLEVINKLGCDEVMPVIPNVVSTDNFPSYDKMGVPCACGRHFIWKDISTDMKKGYLERIKRELGIQLKVE